MFRSRHRIYKYNNSVVGAVGTLPRSSLHGCYEYWLLSAHSCPLLQRTVLS